MSWWIIAAVVYCIAWAVESWRLCMLVYVSYDEKWNRIKERMEDAGFSPYGYIFLSIVFLMGMCWPLMWAWKFQGYLSEQAKRSGRQ